MIKELETEAEWEDCVHVLRRSFATVAEEYGLTEANASTNAAYMTIEKLKEYLKKPVHLYGLFTKGKLIGCVAIEESKSTKRLFYVERLAVIPEERHNGHGCTLMSYAIDQIKEKGGRAVSIGIMNNNKILKQWYEQMGFKENELKRFNHLPFEVCLMSKELF